MVLGVLLLPHAAQAQGTAYEQLQTFSSLLNQIRVSYIDSVSYTEMVRAAIDGVLGSLDPHSRFAPRVDAERELAYEQGSLAGTGMVLDQADDALVVFTVIPKSPAARAGVAAGDRLVSINDTVTSGLTSYEADQRLIGDKGTKLHLVLERGSRLSPATLKLSLKLDFLSPTSVSIVGTVDQTTGYLRLTGFHFKSADEVEQTVKTLKSRGARRLILDLRGNPGGVVSAAVEVASLFFPQQTLVFRTEGRSRSATAEYRTEKDGAFRDLPLMVLIDEGSASASEALAASLQDHDRALLLGRRSFGKALMQRPFPVPPQGDLVWLTVGRVVTPSGRIIQRSYRGLRTSQYYSLAGRTGSAEDTLEVFRTDRGREMRGGGGVTPDVALNRSADLPIWWGVVGDSGWYEAVSDSVAALLPADAAGRQRWIGTPAEWQDRLVTPLLQRVRGRLGVAGDLEPALLARLGRILAHRAAEVRWGPEAADEFLVRNDPDIQAAMGYWDRLPSLLKAS
jgi:carboxyl-terminal processing protease